MTRAARSVPVSPQLRLRFGARLRMGPGKAALLEAIGRTGSISAAAREMRMSYKRAWDLVDELNRLFREPLVSTATGGAGGGGARLTPLGSGVLARYRAMEDKIRRALARDLEQMTRLLARRRVRAKR